jgi:hypothetical protein
VTCEHLVSGQLGAKGEQARLGRLDLPDRDHLSTQSCGGGQDQSNDPKHNHHF